MYKYSYVYFSEEYCSILDRSAHFLNREVRYEIGYGLHWWLIRATLVVSFCPKIMGGGKNLQIVFMLEMMQFE